MLIWLVVWSAFALVGVLTTIAAVVNILIGRPWDARVTRDNDHVDQVPNWCFTGGATCLALAEQYAWCKPPASRVAELAGLFANSQVLFSLVRLKIPDALVCGPKTAQEIAASMGPNTNVEWLERLLAAAHSMGMLKKYKNKNATAAVSGDNSRSSVICVTASARADAANGHADSAPNPQSGSNGTLTKRHASSAHNGKQQAMDTLNDKQASRDQTKEEARAALNTSSEGHRYALNAVSAALTSVSPINMSSFVMLCADNYHAFSRLSEGIETGTIPHELHHGTNFWEWIYSDAKRAQTFGEAMIQLNHVGGSAIAKALRDRSVDCIIDVAGGQGGFMAGLLESMPKLSLGMVFDRPEAISDARKFWSSSHSELLPRVRLVPGDMFEAATIPSPPADSRRTDYALRNILHNWSDADCLKLLKGIRKAAGDAPGVRLLVFEWTTVDDVQTCFLPFRHNSDLAMMVNFGDGKERNRREYQELFAASGWRLLQVKATNGPFLSIEAEPLSNWSA